SLVGCDAISLDLSDQIWAAAMVANDVAVLDAGANRLAAIRGKAFPQPWGQAYAIPKGAPAAFYASYAGNGAIARIELTQPFTVVTIAKGFPVNHGKPGTALAPSGLSYDARNDTLYFADGMNDTIVA